VPQVGVRTTVLASSGEDLGAALRTILENRRRGSLRAAVRDGLGAGSTSHAIRSRSLDRAGAVASARRTRALGRNLKYLALLAAVFSPRPAPLLVFNEPEASLHRSCSFRSPRASTTPRSRRRSGHHARGPLVEAITSLGAGEPHRARARRGRRDARRRQGMLDRPIWP